MSAPKVGAKMSDCRETRLPNLMTAPPYATLGKFDVTLGWENKVKLCVRVFLNGNAIMSAFGEGGLVIKGG